MSNVALFAGSPLSWTEQKALGHLSRIGKSVCPLPPAWNKMMERLRLAGFAARHVDGTYAINQSGRNHLHHLIIEAEARASTALGNYNELKESGRSKLAERQLEASQTWLDIANDLRGFGEGNSLIGS